MFSDPCVSLAEWPNLQRWKHYPGSYGISALTNSQIQSPDWQRVGRRCDTEIDIDAPINARDGQLVSKPYAGLRRAKRHPPIVVTVIDAQIDQLRPPVSIAGNSVGNEQPVVPRQQRQPFLTSANHQ